MFQKKILEFVSTSLTNMDFLMSLTKIIHSPVFLTSFRVAVQFHISLISLGAKHTNVKMCFASVSDSF